MKILPFILNDWNEHKKFTNYVIRYCIKNGIYKDFYDNLESLEPYTFHYLLREFRGISIEEHLLENLKP